MQPRKIPVRRCTGCGEGRPKKELVRIVRSPEGEISLDLTGKKPGRGAYICPKTACMNKARKAKRLENAFGIQIPPEVYELLEQQVAAAEQEAGHAEN